MKKKTPKPYIDPVVEEVRAIRAKLWKQGGGTFEGYIALMNRLSAEREAAKPKSVRAKKSARPTRRRRAA